ncbi:hypothetical protein C922_00775 [Plasmodium inui San Antonio 1]|uniref:Uncharacterized protein n=1 Tax=Plasmodium inui San Antonio 1 TaxID=1237626 RepID=W7ACR2_9APIC|nr:hypothetical protein C922_00775 [Plasmodium inui San Antonio 1]EUD69083.1 hypothetical protein C922_00775 [Plasmodium inui San Antonio 1]
MKHSNENVFLVYAYWEDMKNRFISIIYNYELTYMITDVVKLEPWKIVQYRLFRMMKYVLYSCDPTSEIEKVVFYLRINEVGLFRYILR